MSERTRKNGKVSAVTDPRSPDFPGAGALQRGRADDETAHFSSGVWRHDAEHEVDQRQSEQGLDEEKGQPEEQPEQSARDPENEVQGYVSHRGYDKKASRDPEHVRLLPASTHGGAAHFVPASAGEGADH